MKIKLSLFILFILLSNSMFSQSIKITNHYGSENKEIQDLIDFESIYIEQLNFEGETLKGKSYQIALEEYIEADYPIQQCFSMVRKAIISKFHQARKP